MPDMVNPPLAMSAIIAALEHNGEVRNAEFQLRRVDGTILTAIENARAVRDHNGHLVGYEGTIADISERKRAETAIFEEKEKAQVTLQSIGDAVITTDASGCIVTCGMNACGGTELCPSGCPSAAGTPSSASGSASPCCPARRSRSRDEKKDYG